MSKVKILKKPYSRILCWTLYILAVITLCVFAVSEVYAKYVSSGKSDGSANVAGMGIEVFELVDHGNSKLADHGKDEPSIKYDCTKVIPGVDIPGPHIKLKIKSEVSYTLYVKVKVPNVDCIKFGEDDNNVTAVKKPTVTYKMAGNWVEDVEHRVKENGYTVYTYKYSVAKDSAPGTDFVFKAGEEHVYDSPDTEIQILDGDKIDVSQYFSYKDFDHKNYPDVTDFTLSFETFIRQVIL